MKGLYKAWVLIVFSVILLIPGLLQAQNWEFGVDFILGSPQGDFGRTVDDLGYGLDLYGAYQLRNSPVALGLDIGFLTYGTTRRTEPFSPNIPEVNVRVSTSNNIAFGHLLTRIQPSDGVIRPYLDGLFGFNYLFTESRIRDERSQDEIASSTNFDDITLSGGFGAGSKFHIYRTFDEDSNRLINLFLDLRARYILGGEAEYLREGSIQRDNGNLIFDVERSRTDLLTFHIGIVFQF